MTEPAPDVERLPVRIEGRRIRIGSGEPSDDCMTARSMDNTYVAYLPRGGGLACIDVTITEPWTGTPREFLYIRFLDDLQWSAGDDPEFDHVVAAIRDLQQHDSLTELVLPRRVYEQLVIWLRSDARGQP